MRVFLTSVVLMLFASSQAYSQSSLRLLPKGALILEQKALPLADKSRTLVLWMLRPTRHPSNYSASDLYTCPDETRGSYYSGPTRVSLIDQANKRLINTIKVTTDYEDPEDSFDLPFAIRRGYYYRVEGVSKREAIPNILWLRDYNGDSQALEFALFDAVACMGLQTTLIGYSQAQDRVIRYPIQLDEIEGEQHVRRTTFWADYLMTKQRGKSGNWKYEIDYSGRGGKLDRWEVHYNLAREEFEGRVVRIENDNP